MKTKNA